METINIEALNNLILLSQVLGVFLIILIALLIGWIAIKVLQWSCDCNEIKEKQEKKLAREIYEEYRRLH